MGNTLRLVCEGKCGTLAPCSPCPKCLESQPHAGGVREIMYGVGPKGWGGYFGV